MPIIIGGGGSPSAPFSRFGVTVWNEMSLPISLPLHLSPSQSPSAPLLFLFLFLALSLALSLSRPSLSVWVCVCVSHTRHEQPNTSKAETFLAAGFCSLEGSKNNHAQRLRNVKFTTCFEKPHPFAENDQIVLMGLFV